MSITFYPSTEWKMVETPCDWCAGANCQPGAPDPEYADEWCTGAQRNPDCPTVNYANGNAVAVLAILGLAQGPCGDVEASRLPDVQRRLTAARNSRTRRLGYDADPYDVGGPGTGQCRTVYGGNTDEQTMRRLDQFQEFLSYCREHNCGFYWG